MPWVRLDQNAIRHPKIRGISDGAFRLWVEALTYCQTYLTDGYIGDVALVEDFTKAYTAERRAELISAGLWELAVGGIQVHDFVEWNGSRAQVETSRQAGRDRVQKFRKDKPLPRSGRNARYVTRVTPLGGSIKDLDLDLQKLKKGDAGETLTTAERAGAFCQWYEETHQRIFGIGYFGTQKDYQTSLELCQTFTDAQLHDATFVWFEQNDDFAISGTRTLPKFAPRVTGCLQLIKARGL